MSDIRYVVLSDMHLGQDQSVLTRIVDVSNGSGPSQLEVDPMATAPVLAQTIELLAELIAENQGSEPPVLVLLGDIIELALTEMHISTMVFERFVKLLARHGKPLFSKLIYVPGNHDHHIWERGREGAYIHYLANASLDTEHRPAPHTTSLTSPAQGAERLVQALVNRAIHGLDIELPVEIYYPNLALRAGQRLAVFHHGHYAESIYHLMSTFQHGMFPDTPMPTTIAELERQNFAWIDFFWSAMGRQGSVGANVERVYDLLAAPDKLEIPAENLSKALLDAWHPKSGHWYKPWTWSLEGAEKKAVEAAMPKLIQYMISKLGAHERHQPDHQSFPSQDLLDELRAYANGPLVSQIKAELDSMPADTTFVFGHTHQPFERIWDAGPFGHNVKLYNTGGWAVDPSTKLQPHMGGAAVLLDENLNGASLRFFNQGHYQVELQSADPEGNELSRRLAQLIDPSSTAASKLAQAAEASVKQRLRVVAQMQDGEQTGTQVD